MPPLKLGSTKKNKRKAIASQGQGAKKQKVNSTEDKPRKKATSNPSRTKSSQRSTVDLVRNDDRDLSDEELENVNEYEHFQEFLHNMDPEALARKVPRQNRTQGDNQSTGQKVDRIKDFEHPDGGDADKVYSDFSDDLDTASGPSYDGDTDVIDSAAEDDDDDEPHSKTSDDSDDSSDTKPTAKNQPHRFDNIEALYHVRPNQLKNDDGLPSRLPIILGNGEVQQVKQATKPQNETAITKKVYAEPPTVDAQTTKSTPVAETFTQVQERLARVALEIIEDPEENLDKIKKVKTLLSDNNENIQRLAVLTLSAIFKDIIPGYRIRPLTEVEKAEKITKEVRKLRTFEQNLVAHYQDYTNSLVSFTKVSRKQSADGHNNPLKDVSITAACSLLLAVPHFNFRTELVNIVIGQVVRRRVDETFTKCRTCLETIFNEDEEGEASFEAVRLLCKKMRDREFQIDDSTIGIFLHLRLLTEMEDRGSTRRVDREKIRKKDRQFRTKKLRKFVKDQKEVERDMREAEAGVNVETREKLQGETLKLVFTTYFRILKENNRSILGAALEGLAKFAHLINVDFFGDLLEVLKELMQDQRNQNSLSTRETLLCIVTAFTLLSEQGSTKETINLDLSKFMDSLYACLIQLAFNVDIELSERSSSSVDIQTTNQIPSHSVNVSTEAEMLLRALDAVFFKHRVQGSSRLTAFVKRLTSVGLHFPEKSAAAMIELLKRLVTRYSKIYSLFSTEESAGDGVYNGETDNPELSNTAAATIWEMAMYRNHFSPKVQRAAQSLISSLNETASTRR